jgi:hypothetical protein
MLAEEKTPRIWVDPGKEIVKTQAKTTLRKFADCFPEEGVTRFDKVALTTHG